MSTAYPSASFRGATARWRPGMTPKGMQCRRRTIIPLGARSKQAQLLARRPGRFEMLDGQRRLVRIEAETGARGLEALADHPRVRAAPCHALAVRRIIVLATASLANQRKDVALAVGEIGLQPLAEQVAHLKRQPQ